MLWNPCCLVASPKISVSFVIGNGVHVVLKLGDELLAVNDRNSANLFCEKEKVQKFAFLRNNKQLITIKVG